MTVCSSRSTSADRAAAFSQASTGLVVLDLAGQIVDINTAFLRILDAERDEVIGRAFTELVAADRREDVRRGFAKLVLRTSRSARLEAVPLATEGGRERPVALDTAGLERGGEIAGLVVSGREISRAKPAPDAALVQAQKMQAIGQLAGGIAHDFNNLLTVMIGFSDLLLARHPCGDRSHDDVLQIRRNADRAAALVRQLLAFSRQQALTPVVLDPAAAIGKLASMLARLLGPTITLRLETDGAPGRVCVDAGQLDQVIVNLAVNARDAMPDGGLLIIRSDRCRLASAQAAGLETIPAGDYVRVQAIDTGVGIAGDMLANIFEPFFTTKAAGAGTGLGLATVYGIVRQSGGYIAVDSVPGRGATFSVYLPMVEGAEDETAAGRAADCRLDVGAVPGPAAGSPVEPATILLVDDEPGVRAFAAKALRRAGYRVLEANDGEAALALEPADIESVDLLISDVVMPGMDGPTLMRLLSERLDDLAVVFVSGYAEDVLSGGTGEKPARFLMKPFALQDLVSSVGEALAHRQHGQAGQRRSAATG